MYFFLCRFLFVGRFSNRIHKINIMIVRLPVSYSSFFLFYILIALITFCVNTMWPGKYTTHQLADWMMEKVIERNDTGAQRAVATAIVLDA